MIKRFLIWALVFWFVLTGTAFAWKDSANLWMYNAAGELVPQKSGVTVSIGGGGGGSSFNPQMIVTDGTDPHIIKAIQEAGGDGQLRIGLDADIMAFGLVPYAQIDTDYDITDSAGGPRFWIGDEDGDAIFSIGFASDDYVTISATSTILVMSAFNFQDNTLLALGTSLPWRFLWDTNSTSDDIPVMTFTESDGADIPILNIADTSYAPNGDATNDNATEPGIRLWNDTADSWSLWGANNDNPQITIGGNATSFSIPDLAISFPVTMTEDTGASVLFNQSVSTTPADGTEQSYTFQIDSNNILKIYGEADSAGNSDTHKVIAYPSSTAGAGVNLTREQNSQAFAAGEEQATVTAAHMLDAKNITDQGGSAETDLILTAVSYYIDCLLIDTEGNGFEVCPPSGEAIYLDGTAIAADDCVDSTGAVGAKAALSRQQIADGSYAYFITTIIGTWADGNDTGD